MSLFKQTPFKETGFSHTLQITRFQCIHPKIKNLQLPSQGWNPQYYLALLWLFTNTGCTVPTIILLTCTIVKLLNINTNLRHEINGVLLYSNAAGYFTIKASLRIIWFLKTAKNKGGKIKIKHFKIIRRTFSQQTTNVPSVLAIFLYRNQWVK